MARSSHALHERVREPHRRERDPARRIALAEVAREALVVLPRPRPRVLSARAAAAHLPRAGVPADPDSPTSRAEPPAQVVVLEIEDVRGVDAADTLPGLATRERAGERDEPAELDARLPAGGRPPRAAGDQSA